MEKRIEQRPTESGTDDVKKDASFFHPSQVTQQQTDSSNKNLPQRRSWNMRKNIMERYTEDKK